MLCSIIWPDCIVLCIKIFHMTGKKKPIFCIYYTIKKYNLILLFVSSDTLTTVKKLLKLQQNFNWQFCLVPVNIFLVNFWCYKVHVTLPNILCFISVANIYIYIYISYNVFKDYQDYLLGICSAFECENWLIQLGGKNLETVNSLQ